MSNKYHHIAIGLAGVCQHATLVPQLANTGQCNSHLYEIVLKSIFNTSPKTTDDVFGGVENIRFGLQALTQLFATTQKGNVDVMRYIFGTLGVTGKLLKNDDALQKISQRLERIQSIYPNMNDETLILNHDEISYSLAGIYADIISPLTSKIRVTGKAEYLQNTLVQAKVRTALFGCVRSATLWHQVGGSRLQFFLSRKKIMDAANDILHQL